MFLMDLMGRWLKDTFSITSGTVELNLTQLFLEWSFVYVLGTATVLISYHGNL